MVGGRIYYNLKFCAEERGKTAEPAVRYSQTLKLN